MLRNQIKCKQLIQHLQQQQHLFHSETNVLYNKSTNVFRQGKIMSKLFGNKQSGSKIRWFPSTDSSHTTSPTGIFKQTQFGKVLNSGGKNATRRMTVLNKLFMKHITDLMATGEISESILGKGLQLSRVKISQDFAYVSVFWITSGEPGKDALMEQELQRCSGLLRHELSQLGLMGVVPRIKFVKDKLHINMNQVEALLNTIDFDTEEDDSKELESINKHAAETLKQEFYGHATTKESNLSQEKQTAEPTNLNALQTVDVNIPVMRHDVLGLDHKSIMLKILTKMRKSKQAWEQHQQGLNYTESTGIPSSSFVNLAKVNEKLAKAAADSKKFEAFLAQRKERRNTPERKKFRVRDHHMDMNLNEQNDYPELYMSYRQRQIYEAEDYLADDIDDRLYK